MGLQHLAGLGAAVPSADQQADEVAREREFGRSEGSLPIVAGRASGFEGVDALGADVVIAPGGGGLERRREVPGSGPSGVGQGAAVRNLKSVEQQVAGRGSVVQLVGPSRVLAAADQEIDVAGGGY